MSSFYLYAGRVIEGGEYRRAVATNFTLDDASPNIYYIDFPAVQVSSVCPAFGTCAYGNTLHQASLPSASAAFEITGSAFYLYGLLSPTSGPFTVNVDGIDYGSLTAYCETTISQALLFHKEGLDPSSAHQVVLRNGGPSSSVSLDYIIATSGGNAVGPVAYPPASPPNGGSGTPAGGAIAQPAVGGGTSTDAFGAPIATPTVVEKDSNGDQIGAIIGAVAGVIVFLVIAWMVFRSNRSRSADTKTASITTQTTATAPAPQ